MISPSTQDFKPLRRKVPFKLCSILFKTRRPLGVNLGRLWLIVIYDKCILCHVCICSAALLILLALFPIWFKDKNRLISGQLLGLQRYIDISQYFFARIDTFKWRTELGMPAVQIREPTSWQHVWAFGIWVVLAFGIFNNYWMRLSVRLRLITAKCKLRAWQFFISHENRIQ